MASKRQGDTPARRASRRARPAISERQLSAYFIARDILRRLRDAGTTSAAEPDSRASPPLH